MIKWKEAFLPSDIVDVKPPDTPDSASLTLLAGLLLAAQLVFAIGCGLLRLVVSVPLAWVNGHRHCLILFLYLAWSVSYQVSAVHCQATPAPSSLAPLGHFATGDQPPAMVRGIPTPCRNRSGQHHRYTNLQLDNAIYAQDHVDLDLEMPGPTLLEQSIADPLSRAFFEAATLLEVLREELGGQAPAGEVLHISLEDSLPVSAFQRQCLALAEIVPSTSPAEAHDWLDNELDSLLRDPLVPLSVRTLLVNVVRWHDVGCPQPDFLEIYTDGSAAVDPNDHGPCSWAFSVWAVQADRRLLIGHAAEQASPQGTPFSLGESVQTALTGELLALCWSLAWSSEFAGSYATPVWLLYDARSAGAGTFGCCSVPSNEDSPYRCLFDLATALRQLASGRAQLHHGYVPGHSGCLGNELSDQLAKRARRGPSDPWSKCLPLWVAKLASHALQAWAWTLNASQHDIPRLFVFETEAHRLQADCAKPWKAPSQGIKHSTNPEGDVQFALRLVSFNVLTLLDKRPPSGQSTPPDHASPIEVGMRILGRKDALKRMLEPHRPNIVGIQEARLPSSSVQMDKDFVICVAQADEKGHGGCALWLSKSVPFAHHHGQPVFFREEHVTIVSCSPRHITASLVSPHLRLYVLVVHAPTASHAPLELIKQFWAERCLELDRRLEGTDYIILADANSRLGSVASPHVGDHQPEEETPAGRLFHAFLSQVGALAPSTFSAFHEGPAGTWRGPFGQWHRIDYIAIPQAWQRFGLESSVISSFETLQLRDDHRPVRLLCSFAKRAPRSFHTSSSRKAVRPRKPETPEDQKRVDATLNAVPWFDWQLDIDVHCESLAQAWCCSGASLENEQHARPVRLYVPDSALDIIDYRRALQAYLRQERHERNRRCLMIFFAAFLLHASGGTFQELSRGRADEWLAAMDYSEALALALYRWYGHRLREVIASGKRAYLKSLITEATGCSLRQPKELYAAIRRAFPTAKSSRRNALAPLPMLLGHDGEPVRTTEERDACWRAHFSDQEAGHPVTPSEYVRELGQQRRLPQGVFSLEVVPTLKQIEQVVLRLSNGKAAGADQVTAELLKLSAVDTARRLLPVIMKSVFALREPVSWRGGDLILLAKKAGQVLSCDGYRSVLIASVAGKAFHRCVRAQLLPLLRASQPDLMAGAVEGLGIESPVLAIRSFQLWQHGLRRPWAVIFVDLQSAYYRVLRQLVVQHTGTEAALLSLLGKLSLPPQALQELRAKLDALAELPRLQASPHLQAVISDLLSGTWFRLDGRALLTITARGSRPGDPLADALFALTLSAYLRSVSEQLNAADLLPELGSPVATPPWLDPIQNLDIGAPAWADDYALPQTGDTAERLLQRVVATTEILVTHARSLGMVVKFGLEKTAVLVTSAIVRSQYPAIHSDTEFPHFLWVKDGIDGSRSKLPVVEAYKHLGGIATSNCSPLPDLYHRYARASGIAQPLRRKLFSSHSFDISVRRSLLRALTISKYIHTSAALVLNAAVHQRIWDRQLLALWRHLCRRESAEKQDHPFRVLHLAKAVSPPLAIARTRASFLSKLFRRGPQTLLRFLYAHWISHPASSWLRQFQQDIDYVRQFCPELPHFLPVGKEVECLLEAMAEDPMWWLRQISKAERLFRKDLAQWIAHPPTSPAPIPKPDALFQCWECGASFPLRKHLHVHLAKAHRLYSPARHYTLSPACISCLKWYGTIRQSQQHLKSSPRCLERAVMVVPPLQYAQILELEAPETADLHRLQRGSWKGFSARPPPAKAPLSFGPRLPTAEERLQGLSEEDVTLADLASLFRPLPDNVNWISGHLSNSSKEGPRQHTRRFWQCRPVSSHPNS